MDSDYLLLRKTGHGNTMNLNDFETKSFMLRATPGAYELSR
ncbi:MAG: hypothetical protein V8S94_06550 [Methanobrevibacter smithii]